MVFAIAKAPAASDRAPTRQRSGAKQATAAPPLRIHGHTRILRIHGHTRRGEAVTYDGEAVTCGNVW